MRKEDREDEEVRNAAVDKLKALMENIRKNHNERQRSMCSCGTATQRRKEEGLRLHIQHDCHCRYLLFIAQKSTP